MTVCSYTPQITAQFGRTITNEEIDREFQAIEDAMTCFEEQIGDYTAEEDTIHDHGIIDNSYEIDPAFGVIHYMEVQGDVELSILEPQSGDPRLIQLVIADGGSGRFNFPAGTAWTCDKNGALMDAKPWDMVAGVTTYTGFYGAVVMSIHDGTGWVYTVFARHDLVLTEDPNPLDIYNWR
jgi:hypothetical protein